MCCFIISSHAIKPCLFKIFYEIPVFLPKIGILNYRIAVDFNKLNLEFFKAIIYFRKLSKNDEKSLLEWMRVNPNSLYYIRSLAPWEAELEFAVESYQQFNSIINDLRKKFHNVIRNYEHSIMIHENWMPAYHEMLKANP